MSSLLPVISGFETGLWKKMHCTVWSSQQRLHSLTVFKKPYIYVEKPGFAHYELSNLI